MDAVEQNRYELIPHPAYSPDLAPRDFFLFPNLKKDIRGCHFWSDKEVVKAVEEWANGKDPDFLAHLSTRCSRWAIVITLCPASVVSRPSSVVCRQQFIQSTSPPKLLDQFQNNFTQMFPWSSFTKIAKMVPLRWTKWPSELKIEKPLNDISSQANGPISK